MELKEFLDFTFSSFWTFAGVVVLISIPSNFVIELIKSFLDFFVAIKHGWKIKESKNNEKEE